MRITNMITQDEFDWYFTMTLCLWTASRCLLISGWNFHTNERAVQYHVPYWFLPFSFKANCLILTAVKNVLIFFRKSSEDWFSCKHFAFWPPCSKINLWYFVDILEKKICIGQCSYPRPLFTLQSDGYLPTYLTALLRRTHKSSGQLF